MAIPISSCSTKQAALRAKGKGLTGIDDSKYIYKFGMKLKADSTMTSTK